MIPAQFIPPPSFTTVRFVRNVSPEEALNMMKEYVDADMRLREIPSHNICVEPHPMLNDLLLVSVKKLQCRPIHENQVIVDQSCGLAVLRGAHVFVPGVIAAPAGLKKEDLVSVFVDLDKKCLKGSLKFDGQKFFIGNGIMKVSRHDIFASSSCMNGIGVMMHEPIYLTPCLDFSLLPNIFFPQNLPSTVVGHVLDPPQNSIVLDMCAAPGGKTSHISSIMRNNGKIIALDRSAAKVQKIKDNANRLGMSDSVFAYSADSRNILSEDAIKLSARTIDFSPPYLPKSFKYILLDAPCSALGQRPKFPLVSVNTNVSSYPCLQWRLAQSAFKLLSVGGILVYSTCTTTFEENEGMVQRILNEYPNIALVKQTPHLGGFGRENSCSLSRENLDKLQYFDIIPQKQSSSCHPADKDTIGFFIAKFLKS